MIWNKIFKDGSIFTGAALFLSRVKTAGLGDISGQHGNVRHPAFVLWRNTKRSGDGPMEKRKR